MHVVVKGYKLWVDVCGPTAAPAGKAPVLLLHGFPDDGTLWDNQVKFLTAAGYQVIVPDLLGFGRSDKPVGLEHYKVPAILQLLLAMLDELKVEGKVSVVGHDWGAAVAWALAQYASDRVERLAVLSVGFPGTMFTSHPEQRSLSWYILFFMSPEAEELMAADDWAFARHLVTYKGSCSEQQAEQYIEFFKQPGALTASLSMYRANFDLRSFASTKPPPAPSSSSLLNMPVLGLWSSNEAFLTEAGMKVSEAVVAPGCWRYERVDGAGHWMMRDTPDKVNQLLAKFLSS